MKTSSSYHDAPSEPVLEAANRALGWQTPAEKRLFDAKLATDPSLALEVRRMEDILANLSGSSPMAQAPDSALDKALRRVRDHHREPSARPIHGRWIGWAVAACFAASSAWLALRPNKVSVVVQPNPTPQTLPDPNLNAAPPMAAPIVADVPPTPVPVNDAPVPKSPREKLAGHRVEHQARDINANPRRILTVLPLGGAPSQASKNNSPNANLLANNTSGSGRVVVFEITSPTAALNSPQLNHETAPAPLANHVADVIADAASMELTPPLAAAIVADPPASTNRVADPNSVESPPPVVADTPPPVATASPHAFAVFNESNGQGTIVATDVQPLPPGQVYQLWVTDASTPEPISAGIIPELPDGSGRVSVQLDSSIEISDIFLTIEPTGGSSLPGSDVVLKKQ